MQRETVIVLDFGGQYNQLVARRVRECNVYCEIYSYKTDLARIREMNPKGIIFTGGPGSVYDPAAPQADPEIFKLDVPILGICYGCQLLAHNLGGKVTAAQSDTAREYGKTETFFDTKCKLFQDLPERSVTWMSHGDYMAKVPEGFALAAHSAACPNVAIADDPAGVQGKVLGCTKLTMDLPKVPKVTLPAGYTLADVSRVRLKCYIVDGKATSSRLQIETAGYNEKDNDYKTTGEWLDYVFDMSKIKLTAQQMALNSFSICAGAYGSNISCYIDDIQVQIDHLKGDDTIIEKSDAEKKEIIGGQLDKWVNGVLEVCGGNVSEYIIYDEPLDDESASFDWAAYLGDGYVADVQKAVNDAAGMPVRYFVSQTLSLGENTPADIDEIMKSVAALEAKGVKVDGINLVLDAVYRQEYSAQVKNEAAVEKAMAHLSKIDRPVRISNFTVKVLDHSGMQVSPSSLNTVERQAVAELYEKVVRGYMDGAGANAYGFSFSDVVDGSVNVAPWAAGGNRNFVYEGIVRGLDRK